MSKMNADTRNEVTEAAVMQSISQNKFVREWFELNPGKPISFQELVNNHPKSKDHDMQILRDYVTQYGGAAEILDCQPFGKSFDDGNGNSVLVKNGNDIYVGFDGTGPNGWTDNGQGLYMESTALQRAAAERFDQYVHDYPNIMNQNSNITVTGHSKGANKAMYVTMSARNSNLIASCVALDGQGFSKAAIDHWRNIYSPEVYNSKVSKIIGVSGANDYVHELGISIIPQNNRYTVSYNGKPRDIAGWHMHDYLFAQDRDGRFTCRLNADCKPGAIEGLLNTFMSEYMKLDPAEIEGSAPQIMLLVQYLLTDNRSLTAADGTIIPPEITGVLWALARTKSGKVLLALLMPLLVLFFPHLELGLAKYIIELGLRKMRNEINEYTSDSSGSHVIMLDQEAFMDLNTSFGIVFDEAFEAAQFAEKAERLQQDANVCGALTKTVNRKTNDINQIMNIVVDSFSTVDKENAVSARTIGESYLGSDVYAMVSNI